jgi:hypothetical protein
LITNEYFTGIITGYFHGKEAKSKEITLQMVKMSPISPLITLLMGK